jgi:ubiquinone/menaquinone biosynthesis C-methylase UbiE
VVKARILAKMVAGIRDKAVLDVGCGDGRYSAMLERDNRVVSLDVSPRSAQTTRARLISNRCVVGSIDALPFRDECFDVATVLDILEHVRDDVGAVDELSRILRVGGSILFSVPEDGSLFSRLDRESGHYRRYSADDVQNRLFGRFRQRFLSDFGFPFMRLYIRALARSDFDPRGLSRKPSRTLLARAVSRALVLLFRLDQSCNGSFRGVQLYGLFSKE